MAEISGCFNTNVTSEAAGVVTIKCLEPLFANIITSILALAGVALFIMLLIGGFNFLFAAGDQKKLEKARGTLSGAIGGLIIMVLAYLILVAVAEITGIDSLKTFKINFI